MTSQVKIYKILKLKPAIYVEIIDSIGPFDLELYLDSILIDVAPDKKSNYVFEITKAGEYSVVAKNHDSFELNSNSSTDAWRKAIDGHLWGAYPASCRAYPPL